MYEIEKRALQPNHNHGLASNYVEPEIEEEKDDSDQNEEDDESVVVLNKKKSDPNKFDPFKSSDSDEDASKMDKGMLDKKSRR